MRLRKILHTLSFGSFAISAPAHAVIVAGANGGGTSANTSQASLETAIGGTFENFGNVVRYRQATGIYLGYDPSTKDVWVLTAEHIGTGTGSIPIDGLNYAYQSRTVIASTDLALIRYKRVDEATPTLPTISFASSTPTADSDVIMIGRGRNRTEAGSTDAFTTDATSTGGSTSGYHWASSATNLKRWGTNETSLSSLDVIEGWTGSWTGGSMSELHSTLGEMFFTTFDMPSAGEWLSSNEAGLAAGDSGGGVFVQEGGEWKLAGINSFLLPLDDQDASTTAFGNEGGHINLAAYSDAITAITGNLVPEPSSTLLGSFLLTAVLLKRRR